MHLLKDRLLDGKLFILRVFLRAQPASVLSALHTKMAFELINPLLDVSKELLGK